MRAISLGSSGRRWLGPGHPTAIVAEIGQNHNGRLDLAEQLIDAAAWAGADAVKVVKRDLDCDLARAAREKPYTSRHSFGKTYGEHRRALELSPAAHAALRRRAESHGLLFVATACDLPSVELMDGLGVDAFKIASRDLGNGPLLEAAAARGRPLLLSTGMSSLREVGAAVDLVERHSSRIVLLHCTSLYPTPLEHVHLRSMQTLAARFGRPVGFSDHSRGILLGPVAVALGAVVIEKHLTLDRRQKGTDHAASIEPDELRKLVEQVREVERALGRDDKPVPADVAPVRAKLGRSLVTRCDLPAGAVLDESMFALKSPGDGLPWAERHRVLGRRLRRALPADELLSPDDVD